MPHPGGRDRSEPPEAPSYGRHTLAEVLPSACGVLGIPGFADTVEIAKGVPDRPRHVIVVLVDGLGWRQLQRHRELAPHLHGGAALSAAFPSTTPVGLASLGTGSAPGMHGMVGAAFYLPEIDAVLHPLAWSDDPHPQAIQPERTILERAAAVGLTVHSVGPRAFARSGLTRAALRGGEYVGADSVGERLAAAAAVGPGPALTYVYWGDLDKTGHVHGVDSEAWRLELEHVDAIVERLRRATGPDSLVVVTADHGMVDCPDAQRVDIDAMKALHQGVRRVAGEPRMRHVYAKRGAASEVAATWAEMLGPHAWVLSREGAVDAGYFGDVEPDYADRIGDVLAIAREDVALVSPLTDSLVSSLRGQHGSLTAEEMDVPLIVLPGGG